VDAIKAIRAILVANSAVQAIVGERIYGFFAPQQTVAPYLVADVISVRPSDCKNGASGLDAVRIQIDAVAKTAAQVADLDTKVRLAIDRIGSGAVLDVNIDGIRYDSSLMQFEEERQLRMISSDYEVRIARNVNLPLLPNVPGLQEFTDDEAAIAGGLSVGDFYIIAVGSDVAPAGLIKRIVG
jgi:hypothetical protein